VEFVNLMAAVCTARYIGGICYGFSNSSRGVYWVLVGRPEGRRPLGIPRRKWDDNMKMDLQEVGCVVWTGSSWLGMRTGSGHL